MSKNNNFNLRPFQQKVFEHMMGSKKRVILQAPTGSGKTRAALAPFIHQLGHQADRNFPYERLPLTCRYAVPLRTLANQFHRDYEYLAQRIDEEMPTRIEDEYRRMGLNPVSIQTGEQSNDPQMEAALTFCTIDQLLASTIAIPYGLGKRKANLNVAAIAGSYLVLDEFHLYPLLRGGKSCFGAMTTTIQLLSMLKETTPFVLMTATFSTTLLNTLAEYLDAEIVTVTEQGELDDIAAGRIRTFERSADASMNAHPILEQHEQCSLVVCNTVARAQTLWQELKEAVKQDGREIEVVLLHSRFREERRGAISEQIERELGPAPENNSCGWREGTYYGPNKIVVATQVVEVGLNISVQTLHTEIAPASSIIQRAGRCARFERQQGKVIIYPLASGDGGKKPSYLPYDVGLCEATWTALAGFDKKEIDFPQEQKLIDEVHKESDQEMLDLHGQNERRIFSMIVDSFNNNDSNISAELIRDVVQVQVFIHDSPNDKNIGLSETPWLWQSFSLHPRSLEKWWKNIQKVKDEGSSLDVEYICKKAEAYQEGDAKEPDNKLKTKYQWIDVTNSSQIASSLMVVVPRRLAHYDDEIGFMLLDGTFDGGTYQSTRRKVSDREYDSYKGSKQQSYLEHIQGLLFAYNSHICDETRYIAAKLEQAMHLQKGIIDQAIRLAIACHDLGKLDKQWQLWARTWQACMMQELDRNYELPDEHFLFAKTEYDYSKKLKDLQKKVNVKRPRHACESVMLGRKLIGMSLGVTKIEGAGKEKQPVLRALCGAIARHHTSQACEYNTAQLSQEAIAAANTALKAAQLGKAWGYDIACLEMEVKKSGQLASSEQDKGLITVPNGEDESEDMLETWLYFVIVRALRLADQRA